MTDGALDQNGEGSAAECGSWPTPKPYFNARGSAAPVAQVQSVRASSVSIPGGASELDRPVEVTEATVAITLKLPPSTVERLRKYARSSGLTIGAIVTAALNAFLRTPRKHG